MRASGCSGTSSSPRSRCWPPSALVSTKAEYPLSMKKICMPGTARALAAITPSATLLPAAGRSLDQRCGRYRPDWRLKRKGVLPVVAP